jgi:hypothetical protein
LRVEAAGVAGLEVRAVREQQVDHLGPVEHRGRHQGGAAVGAVAVHGGAVVEEQARDREVALEGRGRQRGLAAVVRQLRVAAMPQEHARRVDVTVVAGQHEQAVAVLVAQVRRQAHAEKLREFVRPARPGMAEHPPGESQRVRVQRRQRPSLVLHPGLPIGDAPSIGEGRSRA